MESILFVCLGNICRSPTARVVFDHRLQQAGLELLTDSAGTTGYHVGAPPDARAVQAARSRGLDLSGERARQVAVEDFTRFEQIYVMDRSNLRVLQDMRPAHATARVDLLMSLVPDYGLEEVPDPYYGADDGFRQVLDMLETAADRLVESLVARPQP
ncbi:low molecular weight phosphotyrosine protein phosphatase [Wenzhouxiangella sp. AB-CW3]|uniref:low molecular weight protein-tyrosine-phosphatase n=1 Tax=Wenzhouxiangella sp. AB-CW3 TaxID=2771012 RepID=UPI00168B951F|nr:low molecular weight protein-tyrosine-phosphatase [Wenzhouxiangella sp. AB-CW3]QOC21106.1 low molecular weight phosphotyrosine protein phosphatase [Wenzhouxiangella sp. AB-CW3]